MFPMNSSKDSVGQTLLSLSHSRAGIQPNTMLHCIGLNSSVFYEGLRLPLLALKWDDVKIIQDMPNVSYR